MHAWNQSKLSSIQVVVVTDAFLCGMDRPNVHGVIFAGGSRTLIYFFQGSGHAGRDGREARVVSLYHSQLSTYSTDSSAWRSEFLKLYGDFSEWVAERRCRRTLLEQNMGSVSPVSCSKRYESDPLSAFGG